MQYICIHICNILSLSTQTKRNWIILPCYCCAICFVVVVFECFDAANKHKMCIIYVYKYRMYMFFQVIRVNITVFHFSTTPPNESENHSQKYRRMCSIVPRKKTKNRLIQFIFSIKSIKIEYFLQQKATILG